MKFIAQGGLGNQLFILAEVINCQRALSPNPKVVVCMNSKSQDSILKLGNYLHDIKIEFSPLAHLMYQVHSSSTIKKPTLQPIGRILPRVLSPSEVSESLPRELLKERGLFAGYFQNTKVVDMAWPILESPLRKILNESKRDLPVRIKHGNYSVVHVRRGDYMKNLKSYGVLSEHYYERVLKLKKYPLIVSTDDYKGAREIVAKLKPKAVFGPKELNSWQTLELMCNARQVFSANSSLSWWASYLAIKSGNESFLPQPWFVSRKEGSTLRITGATHLEANFLQ